MALIRCLECGREISDKSEKCIYCGYPLKNIVQNSAGTVVIYGYTGWFLVKPKLKIYFNGKYIGDVSYKSKTKAIPITEPTNVEIKCWIRSTLISVLPHRHNEIHTEFDRITGSILAELRSY